MLTLSGHCMKILAFVVMMAIPLCAWAQPGSESKNSDTQDVQRAYPAPKTLPARVKNRSVSLTPMVLTREQWKRRLTKKQFYVLREKGTEQRGSGQYLHHKKTGTYVCAGCGNPLFESHTKFDSGTGWPSFYAYLEGRVKRVPDHAHGMKRTEIVCAKCDGHLGHVFQDGPPPTGERHCVNSVSLRFVQ